MLAVTALIFPANASWQVDLVLHPLRSELNWPLGDKQPLDLTEPSLDSVKASSLSSVGGLRGLRWRLPLLLLDALFASRSSPPVMDALRNSPRAVELLGQLRRVIDRGIEDRKLQASPHLLLLSDEFYTSSLRPLLSRWTAHVLGTLRLRAITEREIVEYMTVDKPPEDAERRLTKEEIQV
eukprot:scaffold25495_cov30-Tisochrysis_lutea.AAC.6